MEVAQRDMLSTWLLPEKAKIKKAVEAEGTRAVGNQAAV